MGSLIAFMVIFILAVICASTWPLRLGEDIEPEWDENQTKKTNKPFQVSNNGSKAATSSESKSDVIKCKNCGGINPLSKHKGNCDYCGSPLT